MRNTVPKGIITLGLGPRSTETGLTPFSDRASVGLRIFEQALAHARIMIWTPTLLVLLLSGCVAHPPAVELPLLVRRLGVREVINRSQLIVVGEVTNLIIQGTRRQTDTGVYVKTWAVTSRVELVLKGRCDNRQISYVLNNYEPGIGQNGNFELLSVGDRRILFLVAHGSTLRSVSDLYGTSILLPQQPVVRETGNDPSVPHKIADLLLKPASDQDRKYFGSSIETVTPTALQAAGYEYVSALLQRLMTSASIDVRREACLVSFDQLYAPVDCTNRSKAMSWDDAFAKRLARAQERRSFIEALLRKPLKGNEESPLLTYTTGIDRSDVGSVLEFLRFLSRSSDPILQASAESELRRVLSQVGGKTN